MSKWTLAISKGVDDDEVLLYGTSLDYDTYRDEYESVNVVDEVELWKANEEIKRLKKLLDAPLVCPCCAETLSKDQFLAMGQVHVEINIENIRLKKALEACKIQRDKRLRDDYGPGELFDEYTAEDNKELDAILNPETGSGGC